MFVLACGLVLSLLAWHMTARRTDEEASRSFQQASQHITRLVEERMLRALDLVAGFRGLFSVHRHVSRAEFREHFNSLHLPERFPGVVAIQYAPLVPAAEKAAFEAQVRADTSLDPHGYPDYAIHPAGERDFYIPVLYNEPMAGNEAAFGHDNTAEPSRRRAMERTRDTGEPIASPPLTLLQGAAGFVIRHAVYRRDAPLWTEAQRRAAFLGQVSGVFRTTDLLSSLLEEHLKGYRIRVEDRGDAREGQGPAALLFDSQAAHASPASLLGAPQRLEAPLTVAGRVWVVEVSRPATLPHLAPLPVAVLLSGVALTLVVRWLLLGMARHSDRTAEIAARLAHEATHDALTGLPNRLLLEQRLKEALETAKQDQTRLALLFIDLDRFKAINDTLGHEAGDVVLRQVALRLRGALRPTDTVARLGGDEFVVLLSVPTGNLWRGVADRILALITQPMTYGEHRLSVGASLGAALYPEHGTDAAALLRHADDSMYAAKRGASLATAPPAPSSRAG